MDTKLAHQQVILERSSGESQADKSGIPQETIPAPLLFLIYSNDLPLSMNANIGLYADDTILCSIIHSISDCEALQNDLNSLSQWATWVLQPRQKCLHAHHSTPCSIIAPLTTPLFNKSPSSTKYLSITISNDLTWSTHINKIIFKALSTKVFLQRNLKFCPAHVN